MKPIEDGRRLLCLVCMLAAWLATPSLAQVRTTDPSTSPPAASAPSVPPATGAPAPNGTTTKDAAPGGTAPAAPAETTPKVITPQVVTPQAVTPQAVTPQAVTPGAATPKVEPPPVPGASPLAPTGKPQNNEIERNGSPGVPDNATTENVDVPARPFAMMKGQSSYDDAFKSIKTSLETVKKALEKNGLKASGHPITIFSEPDDKGFKFQAGTPLAVKPEKTDLGDGVTMAVAPAGKAIKFQHRGAYDDIDSTYDVITAFLDAKGMQVDSPYIEEYLTELTTPDDPNLQVDIYVFVK